MNASDYLRAEGPEGDRWPNGSDRIDAGRMMRTCLDGEQALEINGQKLVPDETKGYLEFYLAHGFPVVAARRGTLHVGTVARSYQSMKHQGLNFEHLVKAYLDEDFKAAGEDKRAPGDRYIGGIIDVEFVQPLRAGRANGNGNGNEYQVIRHPEDRQWELLSLEETPCMRCVASIFKQAHGVSRFLGEHLSGRHQYTVSLEVGYSILESVIIALPARDARKDLPKDLEAGLLKTTPADFQKAGLLCSTVAEAPDEMVVCWGKKEKQFTKDFFGRDLVLMRGGLNNEVHFKGTGVVRYGAEPTARLETVLASDPDGETIAKMGEILGKLGGVWLKVEG